ncbi:MAG: tetratricopeptide repeat protein [Myxococcales bacterium]
MRQRSASLAVALLLLTSGPAAGQRALPKKETPKDAELTKKESTFVPEKDLAGDITRKKKARTQDRPALEYDQFRLGVEVQVASKRREQIDTLSKIIQLGPSEREAPDLTFRLAELYWEESKFYSFEANRKDDDIIRAKVDKNPSRLQQAEAEKKDALQQSERFQNLAVDQYRTIIKKYPKYPRMDEVLFFLGHNMWESNKKKEAITVYQKLLKDYPQSKYQPDAWVAVGQYFFEESGGKRPDLERALAAFRKAETFTDSKVYGYAIYMQGWCYSNLGDYRSALDKFKAVIYYGELQGKGDQRATSLSKEARKDYVVAYSHVGDVVAAKSDFQKVGGDEHWWMMLKGLANLYFDDGKDKEATLTYNTLIRERPLSPEAPFFQGRIVDCVMRVGNKKVTVNQVRELVRIIKEVEAAHANKQLKDDEKKSLTEARELAERTLSNLAVNWHNEAKKTRDETVFEQAAEIYQDYLEVFSGSPKSYDLRFFFAELLNDNLNRYDRAADEYTRVLQQDIDRIDPPRGQDGAPAKPAEKPGRWLVNAAYNAILAYDEVAKKFEQTENLQSDGKTKLPIPPPKKNLLAACERYIKYVPQGENKVEVMYKAANILYRYNYFDNAVALFSQIALEHPESELAEYSANLVLDSYNLQADWSKVNEWARKFFAHPKLAKGKFRDDLAKVLEQSAFKLVNQLEQKGEFVAAAEAYLTFVSEFPKSEIADLALFNASVDFFKGKQIDRSIEVRKHIVDRYPNSKYVPQCVFANGEAYETIGDFEQAAEIYEKYGLAYAKERGEGGKAKKPAKGKAAPAGDAKKEDARYEESKAQVALFNAGVFREGLGHYKEALRDRNLYLELWPDGKDSEAVFLSIADLHEKSGAAGKAMAHLEEYEKRYGVRDPEKMLSAELRIARIYERTGNTRGANRIYERILDYYENKLSRAHRAKLGPGALEGVARATYLATEKEFAHYARMGFPQDEKKLKAAFENKKRALDEVEGRYKKVVGFKVADPALCALYKIGLLYKNFADGLAEAPVPEMPLPKQLNPIKHLMDVPWKRWPRDYKEALPEADFEALKVQLAEAKEQFQQEYRNQIMQLALPVEERAAEAFATTVGASREYNIYNECSAEALKLLSDKYKPNEYPRVQELLAEMSAVAEVRVGNPLLTAIQPIPVVAKSSSPPRPVDPPPAVKGAAPAPERRAAPAAAEPRPTKASNEPDDPDLLQ